jgi:SOS response associated peptidase (SRAP)
MCGRYTHKLTWAEIVKLYQLTLPDQEPAGFKASYNVAPTDVMPVIRPAGNGRELVMAKWGLVPWWTKPENAAKPPYSTINARARRDAGIALGHEGLGRLLERRQDLPSRRPCHNLIVPARLSSASFSS